MAKYLFEVSYRVSGGFGGSDLLSTLRRASSAARAGKRSIPPSAARYSMRMF